MELYFLRHGLADRSAWNGADDERPLTEEGALRMAREAESLARLDLAPEVILTSPLVRARQTAQIVAERLGLLSRLQVDERLAADFGAARLPVMLADHPGASSLLLVGHEPSFSETVGELTGGKLVFKKGGLARVDLEPGEPGEPLSGTLVWLLPPKILVR
jgi:phosphohistidine phosphatase